MSECDSSDHHVSVVVFVVIVVVAVNFFAFSTSRKRLLHGCAANFMLMFLGCTPTKFVNMGVLPLFSWNYW